MTIIPFLRTMNTCVRLSNIKLQDTTAMDISSAQLPLDTDERSQLPPSVTDAAREERLRRRRERERARRASERPEEKEARYVKKNSTILRF